MSDTNNNNDNTQQQPQQQEQTDDQLTKTIKEEQQKEVSYVLEASQTDDKRSKYLAKKSEYKVIFDDGKEKTFKRKPLSSRKNKEIDDLRTAFISNKLDSTKKIKVADQQFDTVNDVLYEAFKRTAEYCLGMTSDQYDSAIWEDDPEYMEKDIFGLRSVLGACLLRAVHGVAYFPQP